MGHTRGRMGTWGKKSGDSDIAKDLRNWEQNEKVGVATRR